ncbi:hypothetical protein G5B37_12255 [Rasiella rasia]|uniref:Uncharacterized protein n=1 Tax=Rasiella rasia TaxID=2744027 RepID=A0A6G6GNY5_9FLAO|nr:hypothetical protein [Rasiella rasia]QIE60305.1 hypothetical protein G5B37_12255 [Rasiella rasia]
MKKKYYSGKLDDIKANEIFINIKELDAGNYILNIIHRKKIIKSVYFRKN